MVATTNRKLRLLESRAKICHPAKLDDELCFYCPQDNVDALGHPRIRRWLNFVSQRYVPEFERGERTILLLLPCTKTKPYPLSREHLAINSALFEAGFQPTAADSLADAFAAHLPPGFRPEVLSIAPLRKGRVVVHRAVMSEPLVFVPYEHILSYGRVPSPASDYDDPGLFEGRGNAVSPWRKDFTGIPVSPTRWRWGDEERRAFVTMHNEMSGRLARVLSRLRPHYTDVVAWVAPGLTHRSFVLEREQRAAHGVATSRLVAGVKLGLQGANDQLPPDFRVECLPTPKQLEAGKRRLAARLGRPVASIGGYYSRGGGGATPLALPELLRYLVSRLARDAGV